MKFFSRDLMSGESDDSEVKHIRVLYQQHLAQAICSASADITELAQTNLHDGRIRYAVVKQNTREMLLSLRCGDLQVGYFDLDIQYSGISIDSELLEVLSRRIFDQHTEVLADEIDSATDGRFVHRLFFWPDDEIEIIFSSLRISRQKQPGRIVPDNKQPYLEIA